MDTFDTQILIIGTGYCGLMAANELGRRGIKARVVDQEAGVAAAPQANATKARSKEHHRRRGFANEVRALGLPGDHPTDVAYSQPLPEHGEAARKRAGAYLARHGQSEFTIPGFTFGTRYDGSPVITDDGTQAPPDIQTVYVPTGKPGGRVPHSWRLDGSSLFDHFGFDWTLLSFGASVSRVSGTVSLRSETPRRPIAASRSARGFDCGRPV